MFFRAVWQCEVPLGRWDCTPDAAAGADALCEECRGRRFEFEGVAAELCVVDEYSAPSVSRWRGGPDSLAFAVRGICPGWLCMGRSLRSSSGDTAGTDAICKEGRLRRCICGEVTAEPLDVEGDEATSLACWRRGPESFACAVRGRWLD